MAFTNWFSHTLGGTFMGFCATFIVTNEIVRVSALMGVEVSRNDISRIRIVGLSIGAICGWIYWRIAIKQTPDEARAIDPA